MELSFGVLETSIQWVAFITDFLNKCFMKRDMLGQISVCFLYLNVACCGVRSKGGVEVTYEPVSRNSNTPDCILTKLQHRYDHFDI